MPDIQTDSGPDTQISLASRLSSGIQQGVHLPLPWLIAIISGLIFNTGVAYAQFQTLKDGQVENRKLLNDLQIYVIQDREEHREFRGELTDHESRVRILEKGVIVFKSIDKASKK